MSGIATAIGGAAVLGAVSSSSAASKQSKAANKAADLSQQQYEQTRQDQMPWMRSGEGALNRLNELLGISPAADLSKLGPQFDEAKYLEQNPDVAAAVARGRFTSGLQHYNKHGMGENRPMPMTPAANMMTPAAKSADFGKYAKDFGMSDFTADPGYAFRLAEGTKALERSAAARGGLISGGALKAAQRYGQDMGSQEYTNAFNRYQTNRSNQLNPLQSMAGMGQTTAQQLGNAGANYATNAGNAYGAAGQAAASGIMGGANAISQGVGQYINYNQGNSLIAALNQGGTPSGYGVNVPVGANQYTG